MRKLIATLLLIVWPGAFMSPAHAQRAVFFSQNVRPVASGSGPIAFVSSGDAANFSGTNVGSLSATVTGVPAGAVLVAGAAVSDPTNTMTLTDSAGGTFTSKGSMLWISGSDKFQVFCLPNAAAGSHTVSLSISPLAPFPGLMVAAFSGASATNPCGATPVFANDFGMTANSGNVTSTANNMIVGIAVFAGGTFNSVDGSYTLVTGPASGFQIAYLLEPSAGSFSPTFTGSSQMQWVAGTLALNP